MNARDIFECPHCGKEIEGLVPEGWIIVPKNAWNNLVEKAEAKLPQERQRNEIEHYLMQAEKSVDNARRHVLSARKVLNPESERSRKGVAP